jgi:periplasmic protein TonB
MPITLKNNGAIETPSLPPALRKDVKQRRRMLLAMAVLLVAVVIVLVKDRELWFASGADSESSNQNSQSATPSAPGPIPSIPPAETATPTVAAPSSVKKRPTPRVSSAPGDAATAPMISATDRAVLPPLDVEVVAGNRRQALAASNSSVKVEMQPAPGAGEPIASTSVPEGNADAQVSLSSNIAERVTRPVQPSYPLLAKQMKVQGAVVLQALIDKTGHIEDLHVVSGPTILAAAAREAVKQWHFKPYYQAGLAVETEARITVNFTISTY